MAERPLSAIPEELRPRTNDPDEDPTEKNIKAVRYALDTFAEQLFKDVENRKTRAFCSCMKKVMNAYELKSQKVKSLRKIIKQLRANEQQYQKEIKQLRNQLASSLCKRCGEEIATEQMRVLSMREHNSESLKDRETVVDGQPVENEENEGEDTYPGLDEELEEFLMGFGQYLCPNAGCGFVALLCLFYKMNINFCPLRVIQKCGKRTGENNPASCTQILNDMESWDLIKRIHIRSEEKTNEKKLKDIETILKDTEQRAGLLWYSTEDTKHCVTVHVTSTETQMEIVDAQLNQNYITDLPSVRQFILFVLKFENGKPKIEEEWKECHVDKCKEEYIRETSAG